MNLLSGAGVHESCAAPESFEYEYEHEQRLRLSTSTTGALRLFWAFLRPCASNRFCIPNASALSFLHHATGPSMDAALVEKILLAQFQEDASQVGGIVHMFVSHDQMQPRYALRPLIRGRLFDLFQNGSQDTRVDTFS